MGTISELKTIIGAGARDNKYRVYVPMDDDLGGELDVLVQSTTLPGKTLIPTEVIVRGRKTYLRGEMSFNGAWEMTFFNTEDMKTRNYFIDWMNQVHDTNMNSAGLLGGLSIGGISLNSAVRAVKGTIDAVKGIVENPLSLMTGIQPVYQRDLKIEQLNWNGEGTTYVKLIGAFPTDVSAIEYKDSNGEVSTTTVTFAYTDVEVDGSAGTTFAQELIGNELGNLF